MTVGEWATQVAVLACLGSAGWMLYQTYEITSFYREQRRLTDECKAKQDNEHQCWRELDQRLKDRRNP